MTYPRWRVAYLEEEFFSEDEKSKPNISINLAFSSVQSLSRVRLFATPWTAALQASLSINNSRSPPKPMSIESVMPSSHLILCRPLLLLPPIPPSIRVFSNESTLCMRWPNYWSFRFSIRPSNEHPGLISFMMDWLDLLAVQGTLKSLPPTPQFKSIILPNVFAVTLYLFILIGKMEEKWLILWFTVLLLLLSRLSCVWLCATP